MANDIERVPLTAAGKKRLEQEIQQIKTVDRPKNIRAIEEAREHGDLSENAEYHAAKEQQGQLAARLNYLEDQLARSEVIPEHREAPDRVVFGAEFCAVDVDTEKEVAYRIVGEYEAEPDKNLLSVASPIARAFIGKSIGDEVNVRTPAGLRTYEILDIKP